MKTRSVLIFGAILVILIAFNFLSPFIFLRSLSQAAERGDRDTISAEVDFPAVRDSLKGQLGRLLARKAVAEASGKRNPFARFAMRILPSVGGQVIDAVVTPDGIATILKRHVQQSGDSLARPSLWRGQFAWLDVNHFRARYVNANHPDAVFGIILERRGLFGWQVTGIRLPLDQLL
jgi:hypothetical protein